jgi:hypothetical protein
LSEEECDSLEREEEKQDEEMAKQRPRNILQDLQHNMDGVGVSVVVVAAAVIHYKI